MTLSSMTAFSRCESQAEGWHLCWEVRAVNHRYCEIFLNLPSNMKKHESAMRQLIGKELNRGRIDAVLNLRISNESRPSSWNREGLIKLRELHGQLEAIFPGIDKPVFADVLQFPDALISVQADSDECIYHEAMALLENTMDEFRAIRQSEGNKLKKVLLAKLEEVKQTRKHILELLPDLLVGMRDKLQSRIEQLQINIDPARLEQELALLVNKADITEELDRIDAHIEEMARLLELGQAVGRRLDFVLQELHREANTLGVKCTDIRMINLSIDLKLLFSQMREQVQNIE